MDVGLLLLATALTSGGGNSFQPLPLTSDGGVAPLGRSCADAAWHSQSLPLIFGEG